MVTFQKVKLKDVTTKIGSGATPRGGKGAYHHQGVPLIRSMNIYDLNFNYSNLAFIDETQAKQLDNVVVEKDDILLNITGASVCRCTSVPDKLVPARVNQHVSIIRADNKGLIGKYLKYVLVSSSYKRELYGLARTGATREALTKIDIENFEIKIPDLKTQTRIASVLSAYDDLIENNEKRIKALEEMAQLLYTEWFVKFKFPGHKKIKMVESGTEFGKIPEGWKVGNFVNSEIYLSCKDRIKKFEGEKLYFDTSCVDEIRIVKEPLNVDWNTMPSRAQFFPVYNSVWFARMAKTYKVLVFDKRSDFEVNNYLLSSGMLGIKTEEKYLGFLFALIKSEAFHKQKDSKATGATQVSLTNEGFSTIQIVFPSIELIEKYSNIVNGYIGQILEQKKQNKNLSQIRDLLIPQLVTGKRGLK